jgi:hypothetical protein
MTLDALLRSCIWHTEYTKKYQLDGQMNKLCCLSPNAENFTFPETGHQLALRPEI